LKKRVVVTGIGIITALGSGKDNNWTKLVSGQSGIRSLSAFDPSGYRGKSGGEALEFTDCQLHDSRTKRLDRASLLLIEAAREAVKDSGLREKLKEMNVLLSLGTTLGGMISGEMFHREVMGKGLMKARLSLLSDYLAHCQAINLFRELGLKGDFLVFADACASGANAIGHAFRSISSGEYELSICGGYDTMNEFATAGFNSLMAVTPTLCRPFDKNRDGLVLGEGSGILVLEELEHAVKRNARIIAEIAGYGETSDAYHMTSPEPSGRTAGRAIAAAWKEAGQPKIDYINAHGTGTRFNDIMETNALVSALGEEARAIPVSSTKPATGHILGGAGAVEVIISLLAIKNKGLPPNMNYESPDPECNLNIITRTVGYDVKTVLSNSFGFGGANASVLVREYL
jgi:3-oxoacyl-[acyl-carrier-protein] synthase II